MDRLLSFGLERTGLKLALLAIVTLVAMWQLPDLELEITAEGLMVEGDPARDLYTSTLQTFGSEDGTVLYFESEKGFEPQALAAIGKAVARINDSHLVDRTVSLFSLRYLRTVDGFTYTSPYLKPVPRGQAQVDRILNAALHNPLVRNNLLSDDLRGLAINIYIDPRQYHAGFDQAFAELIESNIGALRPQFKEVFFVGNPYVRIGLSERIRADQQMIIPGAIAFLLLTLALVLRRLVAPLIPLLTALLSIIWILGLMAWLGVPLNVTTSVIPALLIIIGSTEDIHLMTEHQRALRQGATGRKALERMTRNMGTAVVLTFVTTYAGFLSITTNRIDLLQQFGLLASTGLLFNFLITVLVVPVCLRALPPPAHIATSRHQGLIDRATLCVFEFTQQHRRLAIGLIAGIAVVAAGYASGIRVNNSMMDYFNERSDLVRHAGHLHDRLSGIHTLSIIVTGPPGTFEQVPYLQELWTLQEHISDDPAFDSSYSFADFVGIVHSGLDGEHPGRIYLPDYNDIVREYMAFLHSDTAASLVSPDFSQARILVRHNVSDSGQLNRHIGRLLDSADIWLPPGLKIAVTGESYLNSRAIDYMAEGQGLSLAFILVTIFLVVSILFTHPKAGMVAVVANLFPIILLFGAMGLFDLALNTSTAMVAAISLGIGVDYSVHFMVRYHRLSRDREQTDQALRLTVEEEALPIVASAIALAASFAALTVSDFPPVARFGQLSALVMVLSLVSTFVIIPLMLRHLRLVTVWDLLSVQIREHVVRKCGLFQNMHSWQARKAVALSRIETFGADEAVILQGDRVRQLYLVLEGSTEGWRTRGDGSTYLAGVHRAGDVFGVLPPGSDERCRFDVVATEPTRVLELGWRDLDRIAHASPRLGMQLFRNLSMIIARNLERSEDLSDSVHDELSGAFSRRVLMQLVTTSVERAKRYSEAMSLLAVRLDLGPADVFDAGSRTTHNLIMREVAVGVTGELRDSDMIGRWQDRSFLVVLPNTDEQAAVQVAKRIAWRTQQNSLRLHHGVGLHLCHLSLAPQEHLDSLLQRLEASMQDAAANCIPARGAKPGA